jgi:hypothetical protein
LSYQTSQTSTSITGHTMAKKKSNFWTSGKDVAKTRYSSYWLSDSRSVSDYKSILTSGDDDSAKSPKHDIYALAESQEAISNFVRILTQRNDILVKYRSSSRDENYTDGKSVVISPNLEGDEFDVAVGLALHEASHIMHTDFTKLEYHVGSNSYYGRSRTGEAETRGLDVMKFKAVWNCIEDFYIDSITYKTAPGYRGYYQALYQKYFGMDVIEKGLNSTQFSVPNWDSYLFHLCNIRNPKRNLNALAGMTEVWDMLDLKNIARLENPDDRFDLTYKIYDVIARNIQPENQTQSNGNGDESEEQDSQGSESSGNGNDTDQPNEFSGEDNEDEHDKQQNLDLNDLSATMKKRLDNILQKQMKYFDGDVSKGKIAKTDSDSITNIQQMGGSVRVVAKSNESTTNKEFSTPNGVRVVVIRNMNESLIEQGSYQKYGISKRSQDSWTLGRVNSAVNVGIMRGRALAKKLQIRNEERITKTTRLSGGNIDRRLLSELGFDNARIFSKLNIVSYKPVHIHISIDQSSSMSGSRFEKSMEVATALATASLGIKNLNVVVSLRGMDSETPYILYLFDSRKHNVGYIRNMFSRAYPHGCTPEGLTFEAIEKEIKKDALHNESYFINICDGQPSCNVRGINSEGRHGSFEYGGTKAQEHSKKQMLKMESHGVKYIAYLLTDSHNSFGDTHAIKCVRNCYADRMIVLNGSHEIEKISRSLNKKLLEVF